MWTFLVRLFLASGALALVLCAGGLVGSLIRSTRKSKNFGAETKNSKKLSTSYSSSLPDLKLVTPNTNRGIYANGIASKRD